MFSQSAQAAKKIKTLESNKCSQKTQVNYVFFFAQQKIKKYKAESI